MAAAAAFTPALKNIRPGGYFSELGNKFHLKQIKFIYLSHQNFRLRVARAGPTGGT
jgi:hypothetical protein